MYTISGPAQTRLDPAPSQPVPDRAPARNGHALPQFIRFDAAPPPPDSARNDAHPRAPGDTSEPVHAPQTPHRFSLARELGGIDPLTAMGWVLLRWRIVVLCAALGMIAAGILAVVTPPRYTTYVDMFVDPSDVQVLSEDLFVQSPLQDALLLSVESKMRYLTATSVLRTVVERLELANDPEFVGEAAGPSLLSNLPLVGGLFASAPAEEDRTLVALRELYDRVSAQREERSFVVTLGVWARTPDRAVTLANAIVEAFQAELSQADSQRASAAADALTARLAELRGNVMDAEASVESYRRDNGLQASAGELVSGQALTQLNAQLLDAQSRVIQAQARYDELSGIDVNGLAASDVIESEVLSDLRSQYAALRQEIDAQSSIFGPRHPNITRLQPQLAAVSEEIEREIARRVQASATELQEAEMVAARLANEIARARGSVSTDNAAQVQLRELERDAAAQAAIYEAFLVRAGEITQREQIDTTNVRVMSPAVPPRQRDFPPRTVVLLGLGAVAGALVGVGLAALLGLWGRIGPGWRAREPQPIGPDGARAAA